jgi:hypothetical protein
MLERMEVHEGRKPLGVIMASDGGSIAEYERLLG